MSLSARIAIGPSARLAAAETGAVAGGLMLAGATFGMWIESPWSSAIVASALACVSARLLWRRRMAAGTATVLVSEGRDVTLRWRGGDFAPLILHDATTAWPGFIGLSLVRPDRSGGVRTLAAMRSALDADDARRLYRYLLWASRGGCHAGVGATTDRRIG